jgi:hypothetical protein
LVSSSSDQKIRRLRAGRDRIGRIDPDRFDCAAMRAFEQPRFKATGSLDTLQDVAGSAAIALQMTSVNIVVAERLSAIRHVTILPGLQLAGNRRVMRVSMS